VRAEFRDQAGQGLLEVQDRGGLVHALAVGPYAGTELGVSAPDAIFVRPHDVGDVYYPSHAAKIPRGWLFPQNRIKINYRSSVAQCRGGC
jgi:hypothetical protein